MRAVNHGLTGAAIAVVVKEPLLAIPLAFLSHFVCDFVPHSGDPNEVIASRKFWVKLIADMALAVVCTLAVALVWSQFWWLVILCAFMAASPDLAWLYYKVLYPHKKQDRLSNFHHYIQWYQKPPGVIIEIIWFVSFFSVLMFKEIG